MSLDRYRRARHAVIRVFGVVQRHLIAPTAQRLDRKAAERALQQIDDRTLRDIGLTRGQISGAIRSPEVAEKTPVHLPSWPITG